jgi:hypothetical protein
MLLVSHALSVLVVRHRQGFTMKDLHPSSLLEGRCAH